MIQIASMFVAGMFVIAFSCLTISSCKNEIKQTETNQTDTIAPADSALDSLTAKIKQDTITTKK